LYKPGIPLIEIIPSKFIVNDLSAKIYIYYLKYGVDFGPDVLPTAVP
jgi:hypothetical protein